MRVFLDTNVLISAVATRGICADIVRVVLAEHRLILGETVVAEMRRVLRDKLRVPERSAGEFEELLRREGTLVGDAPPVEGELRDPSDAAVLAEALAGEAEVLVTGDRDLLELSWSPPLVVVSPRGFWERQRTKMSS